MNRKFLDRLSGISLYAILEPLLQFVELHANFDDIEHHCFDVLPGHRQAVITVGKNHLQENDRGSLVAVYKSTVLCKRLNKGYGRASADSIKPRLGMPLRPP